MSINIFRHCGEERTPLFIVDSVFTMFSNACEAVKIYITKQHQHTRHTSFDIHTHPQYLHLCAEIYRKYHLIGLSLVNIKSPSKSRSSTLTTMLPYNKQHMPNHTCLWGLTIKTWPIFPTPSTLFAVFRLRADPNLSRWQCRNTP